MGRVCDSERKTADSASWFIFRRVRTVLEARVHLFARFRSSKQAPLLPKGPAQNAGAKAKRDVLERFEATTYRCDSIVKAATA